MPRGILLHFIHLKVKPPRCTRGSVHILTVYRTNFVRWITVIRFAFDYVPVTERRKIINQQEEKSMNENRFTHSLPEFLFWTCLVLPIVIGFCVVFGFPN